jgi:methyl-accepting chemotaxis protein
VKASIDNVSIVTKVLAILALFGVLAGLAQCYETVQMRQIAAQFSNVGGQLTGAIDLLAGANSDVQTIRMDIGMLTITQTTAANDALLAEIATDRANFDRRMNDAELAIPDHAADIRHLKAEEDAILDRTCARAIVLGGSSTSITGNIAAQKEFLLHCQPALPGIVAGMRDQRLALEHEAWAARAALTKATDRAITSTFALMFAGLALVMAGGFFALRSWVIAPLLTLQNSITQASSAAPAPQFEASERGDEIGVMARAMQYYMSDTMAQLRQEAREYARRAEQERRSLFADDGALTNGNRATNAPKGEGPA